MMHHCQPLFCRNNILGTLQLLLGARFCQGVWCTLFWSLWGGCFHLPSPGAFLLYKEYWVWWWGCTEFVVGLKWGFDYEAFQMVMAEYHSVVCCDRWKSQHGDHHLFLWLSVGGLDDPHVSFSQSIALVMMRAGGDMVNAHLFHHLLKVLAAVAWAIVCDNRLGYTIFTEYCFHVLSDKSCCDELEHADNWKVVYDEQVILLIKYEYVRGQFCLRCCWDFMTKWWSDALWVFVIGWRIFQAGTTTCDEYF